MKRIETLLAYLFLLFAVGWNLWLYKDEVTIRIDPNDNAFQYALVDRTNTIWEYAQTVCPNTITYPFCLTAHLIDHWVPNWAQGYNLPYYYSHIPQITIVASYRIISQFLPQGVTLFTWYHMCIYLLLSLVPLSLFIALRILGVSYITSGIGALLASHISTDGLYGIDQSSFLWRGWGLSSQLFALLFFPLALASMIMWVKTNKRSLLIGSYVFLTLTTIGHLGIGMMAFLAIPVVVGTQTCLTILEHQRLQRAIEEITLVLRKTLILIVPTLLLLSYWIIPIVLNDKFHNISIWDPIWKFNSFGIKEVVTLFINGNLFDFGRFPTFTILVMSGLCMLFFTPYKEILFVFVLYILLFFGKTTWGGLLSLIPGMNDFHQHRFLVGMHIASIFIIPLTISYGATHITNWLKKYVTIKQEHIRLVLETGIGIIVFTAVVGQTISYATYNTTLIHQANTEYENEERNFTTLLQTLNQAQHTRPGRVYALRGAEGKDFKIASTPYYMALSTYGIPTVLWLPETWSMNSDTEQFFSEDNPDHYNLMNIAYVVAPPNKSPQPFWHLVQTTSSWNLYDVQTPGYIAIGTAPSIVYAEKTTLINLIHLWYQSLYPKTNLLPELRLTTPSTQQEPLPTFTMIDPISYKTPDNKIHSLMQDIPVYQNPEPILVDGSQSAIQSQTQEMDMRFSATVTITKPCPTCIVYLKQTSHPNWIVTVNGKRMQPIIVFPFYTAVRIDTPGTYEIVFSYTPSRSKLMLFYSGIFGWIIFLFFITTKKQKSR